MATFTSSFSGGPPLPSTPRGSEAETIELRREIGRLLLITEGLWRILKEKHGLEETELIKQITMVDLEDGKLDGRVAASPPEPCPKCHRVLAKNRPRCLFCGEPVAVDPFQR